MWADGYQNGEKGEWCKTTNFELATRIPMFVVAPPSLGGNFAKGVVVPAVVESVDLMVTLADLVRSPCHSWIMSVLCPDSLRSRLGPQLRR